VKSLELAVRLGTVAAAARDGAELRDVDVDQRPEVRVLAAVKRLTTGDPVATRQPTPPAPYEDSGEDEGLLVGGAIPRPLHSTTGGLRLSDRLTATTQGDLPEPHG